MTRSGAASASGKVARSATPLPLARVLVFIGTKIFLVGIIGRMPPAISLSVTFGRIAGGVRVSLWKTRGQPAAAGPAALGSSASSVA